MNIALLIFGMALVTYLPRVIPSFVVDKLKFGRRFGRFINLITFTAMTALIVPGVFSTDPQRWYVGVVGGIVAVALACIKKIPSAVVVIASVASVMITYLIV